MIEIDFYEVVSKKLQIISKNEHLLSLIRSATDCDLPILHEKHVNSHQYKLFAQDIRETDLLAFNLTNLGVDFSAPTLVMTECLLVYLKKEDSDRILQTVSSMFQGDLLILNYEMIHPSDPFGKVMVENLENRGCQLLGIYDCPNEDFQIKRMKETAQLPSAECYNMSEIYAKKLEQTEKKRIEKLEIFDEFEEWELLQKHYCLCLGKRVESPDIDAMISL